MSKIARRRFIKLSAAATAACLGGVTLNAAADESMPELTEDDAMAQQLGYVADASSVDPAKMVRTEENQTCANCSLLQGAEGDALRPCQLFPGKLVQSKGWCTVWAPKA